MCHCPFGAFIARPDLSLLVVTALKGYDIAIRSRRTVYSRPRLDQRVLSVLLNEAAM
jgi:hypothetical protein